MKALQMLTAGAAIALPVLMNLPGKAVSVPAAGQGSLVSTCAQVLMTYVGKPFLNAAASEAGTQVARYFGEKVRNGGAGRLEQRDVDVLRQRGVSECEIRQSVEAMQGIRPQGQQQPQFAGYVARSTCSATGAMGVSQPAPSRPQAAAQAVQTCVAYGGIYDCCVRGTQSLN